MEFNFYKIKIGRNDYILVNGLYGTDITPEELPRLAAKLCRRGDSVGGNGLLLIERGYKAPLKLHHLGPDGEKGYPSNDALLCAARLAFDSGLPEGKILQMETDSGIRTVEFLDSRVFRTDLGSPSSWDGAAIEENSSAEYNLTLDTQNERTIVTPLNLQRNCAVVFSPQPDRKEYKNLEERLNSFCKTDEKILPVFCQVFSRNEIAVQAWTGKSSRDLTSLAGISVVASVVNGFTERTVTVNLSGSKFLVEWTCSGNIKAAGRAEYVYSGTYEDSE